MKFDIGDVAFVDLEKDRKGVRCTVTSISTNGKDCTVLTDSGEYFIVARKLLKVEQAQYSIRRRRRSQDLTSNAVPRKRSVSKSRIKTASVKVKKRKSSRNRSQTDTKDNIVETPILINSKPDSNFEHLIQKQKIQQSPVPQLTIESDQISKLQFFEFGGPYGALFLMITFPLFVLYVNFACANRFKCFIINMHVIEIALGIFKNFIHEFRPLIAFCILTKLIALSMVFPVINGVRNWKPVWKIGISFPTLVFLTITTIMILEFSYIYQIFELLTFSYHHFLIYSLFYGMFLSIFVYLKSFQKHAQDLNKFAQSNSHIYDFFMGREVLPKVYNYFDIKRIVYRTSFVFIILYEITYLLKSLKYTNFTFEDSIYEYLKKSLDPTVLVLITSQLIYLLDSVFFESAIDTTFDRKEEGFGYMLGMGFSLYPFMFASVLKQVYDNEVQLPIPVLIVTSILFIFSYTVMHLSNAQKNLFRTNPNHPSFAKSNIIITKVAQRNILADGLWKWCRHPNYLGEILMHVSWIPFCWNLPSVFILISIITLLIHRARRIQRRCLAKYDLAWVCYCDQVKYLIFPKIF